MFCSKCGRDIPDGSAFCNHCGFRVLPDISQLVPTNDGPIGILGVACFFLPVLGLVLYVLWRDRAPMKARGAGKAAIWGVAAHFVIILLGILFALGVPLYLSGVQKTRSNQAQTAITALRQAYDQHYENNGPAAELGIEEAVQASDLDPETLNNWSFQVFGDPPEAYVATSTAAFPDGAGKQVWYGVWEGQFHGYGIDAYDYPFTEETETGWEWEEDPQAPIPGDQAQGI
ncbi:MAG: zinc-ribbon domain-containing protein [Candidatus Syntrophosphaera sp.]|nr:zinc-ribbon domain-containing protein [Candidatus Syntrophosphaera sp.]